MSAQLFRTSTRQGLLEAMRQARLAVGRGQVACIPTDTAYALVADAFKPSAVAALREAKGMAPGAPLGVFLPGIPTLRALATDVPDEVETLAREFWPGGLTLIVAATESLAWDLGNTGGTVALRMPANTIALELLSETGPLVQSGAWREGQKPLVTAAALAKRFSDSAAVVLAAAGEKPGSELSSVIDCTRLESPGGGLRIVREGVIPARDIYDVVPRSRFI